MILTTAPQDQAVMSNVSEIGEFKIRHSAKAFSILSSGLYANKIRAVIRELSCNAVDSHAAAGKSTEPFIVHLPTRMEPWFSVRDAGTGLTHEEVCNIYTTYFESTKTGSNDFIGALGLGSKSPFSYTDNFTVAAIKDGVKGTYSAFINDTGVPSIALMESGPSDESSGVEIKFSINNQYDFSKFVDEARIVFTHFALRPTITGVSDFKFRDVAYTDRNIIPGVHLLKESRNQSVAVMGNIAYPINIPNSITELGKLKDLIECGLEMHFAIGELDFQASREGLSYIPQTITAIHNKLVALNAQLAIHIAAEADKIVNEWDRATYLHAKGNTTMWHAAVEKYVLYTNFQLLTCNKAHWPQLYIFKLDEVEIAKKYNVKIRGFSKQRSINNITTMTAHKTHASLPGTVGQIEWQITVGPDVRFVTNTSKIGAVERAKHHWRVTNVAGHREVVYVLEASDKTQPAKFDEFFLELHSPLQVVSVDTLTKKDRVGAERAKNVTILKLEQRHSGYYSTHNDDVVWRDGGKAGTFDEAVTYYYVPLSGYSFTSKFAQHTLSIDKLYAYLKRVNIAALSNIAIYGVRKGDIEVIKTQENWVNLEDHIVKTLATNGTDLLNRLIIESLNHEDTAVFSKNIAELVTNASSKYKIIANKVNTTVVKDKIDTRALSALNDIYASKTTHNTEKQRVALQNELTATIIMYPMLALVGDVEHMNTKQRTVAAYINLIDAQLVD